MARIGLIVLGILAVLLVAALVIPFFIPTDVYKAQIQSAAKQATGRELVLKGDLNLSLLPPVRLSVEDVTFSNAEWGKAENMAEIKSLTVGVDPFAFLFGGKVKINQFVLDGAAINLEVGKDGRENWSFDTAAAPETPEEAAGDGEGLSLQDISLGDVRLENATLTYTDAATGETETIEDIDTSLALPTFDGPFKARGGLTYKAERINLTLDLAKPRAFMDGEQSALGLSLRSALMKASFDGTMAGNLAGKGLLAQGSGSMEVDVPSMRKLAKWLGEDMPPGKGYGPLSVSGQATAKGNRLGFTDAKLRVDEMTGTGAVAVDIGGARPAVTGNLAVNKLDLLPYQDTSVSQAEKATSGAATGSAGEEGWSTEPLDFSALKLLDADLTLTANEIITNTIKTGKARVTVSIINGLMNANLRELGLYEGGGSASFVVDARGSTPFISNKMNLDAVKALPLLRDLIGMGILDGVGAFELNVQSRGRSQREIVQALNGAGRLKINDGAFYGVNLPAMLRKVDSAIGGFTKNGGFNPLQSANMLQSLQQIDAVVSNARGGGSSEKTDFAEFSGTFRIENGVFRNDDMLLLNPLLRATGNGTSDLVRQTVDYRILPKLVGSLEGQGGASALTGIGIPIRVTGTWSAMRFSLDSETLVKELIKSKAGGFDPSRPEGLVEGILGGKKKTGTAEGEEGADSKPQSPLEGLLGGRKKPEAEDGKTPDSSEAKPEEEKPEEEAKPGDRLRDLFGRGQEEEQEEEKDEEEEEGSDDSGGDGGGI